MRALAGVMKYVGIVLISCVLILTFCTGLMFFMPKMRLFGFYFRQVDAKAQLVEGGEIELNSKFKAGKEEVQLVPGIITYRNTVKLTIEAHNYDVVIQPTDAEKISIYQESDYIGFLRATTINEGTPYQKTYDQLYPVMREANIDKSKPEEGKYHWVFEEPSGLLNLKAENSITIRVPYQYEDNETKVQLIYDLDIRTHNGDVFLQNSVDEEKGEYYRTLNINALSLKTNKGSAIIEGVGNGGNENVVEGKIVAPKQLNLNRLNIDTNGGTFDFRKYELIDVGGKVSLTSKKAKYLFNNLTTYSADDHTSEGNLPGGVIVEGENVEFVANNVYCGVEGFTYKSETGVLRINNLFTGKIQKIDGQNYSYLGYISKTVNEKDVYELYIESAIPYENTIFTDTAAISLGTIVGKLGMYNEQGNVSINMLCHQSSIRTENGDITIKRSGVFPDERENVANREVYYADTSSLILYSTYGNIEATEYYQDAVVYSKKGKIKLTSKYVDEFATKGEVTYEIKTVDGGGEKVEEEVDTKRYYYTDVTTKDGQVWVTSEKNPVRINATDNATINVIIKDVLPEFIELCQYKNAKNELTPYYYSLNPFKNDSEYMYQFKTQNGRVDATLPIKSYKIKIESNKIEGHIGATESTDFKVKDADGKMKPVDVQVSGSTTTQPSIYIKSSKTTIRSDI